MQYSVVQVSQYSCDDEYVAAQIGCFQYFTGLTGTLQSYNFAGAAQIKVQTRLLQCCSVLTAAAAGTQLQELRPRRGGLLLHPVRRGHLGRQRRHLRRRHRQQVTGDTVSTNQSPVSDRSSNQVLGLHGVRV